MFRFTDALDVVSWPVGDREARPTWLNEQPTVDERDAAAFLALRPPQPDAAVRVGRRLQWATIVWNSIEVFVTIGLGIAAGSLALVAFGLDSLVEVFASLVVIWHMSPGEAGHQARRDWRALRLVGVAFAVLAAYLLFAGTRQLLAHEEPDGSPVGIAYLAVTAVVMFSLARWKRRVGKRLDSDPFRAEASMTFLDGCLATSILIALGLNLLFEWWWADPTAALLIGAVAVREARDAWREARESPRPLRT